MIMPMVVDLEVDATLGDEFYYYWFVFIHKKNQVLLSHIYNFFEKSYKWVWDLRTLAHFQGSEMSPDGIRA